MDVTPGHGNVPDVPTTAFSEIMDNIKELTDAGSSAFTNISSLFGSHHSSDSGACKEYGVWMKGRLVPGGGITHSVPVTNKADSIKFGIK